MEIERWPESEAKQYVPTKNRDLNQLYEIVNFTENEPEKRYMLLLKLAMYSPPHIDDIRLTYRRGITLSCLEDIFVEQQKRIKVVEYQDLVEKAEKYISVIKESAKEKVLK